MVSKLAPIVLLERLEFFPFRCIFRPFYGNIFAVVVIAVLKLVNVLKTSFGVVGFFDKHFVIFVNTFKLIRHYQYCNS